MNKRVAMLFGGSFENLPFMTHSESLFKNANSKCFQRNSEFEMADCNEVFGMFRVWHLSIAATRFRRPCNWIAHSLLSTMIIVIWTIANGRLIFESSVISSFALEYFIRFANTRCISGSHALDWPQSSFTQSIWSLKNRISTKSFFEFMLMIKAHKT